MIITLKGRPRERLRADLKTHRASRPETDADYAEQVLGVSLNTFRKCIGPTPELSLRRQSFIGIVRNAGHSPADYGVDMPMPGGGNDCGGYSKQHFSYIAGRYLYYRRSFLTGVNVTRSVLDIAWSDPLSCLTFDERLHYVSDRGVPQNIRSSGRIYMHPDRVLMSLLAIADGEVRVTMLHTPSRRVQGEVAPTLRTRGVLLTHGFPRGNFQPVISPVFVERLSDGSRQPIERLCQTIRPGEAGYERAMSDLADAEDNAVVMTPLLWRSHAGPPAV